MTDGDYFNQGSFVRCTLTKSQLIEGNVLAFDLSTKILILSKSIQASRIESNESNHESSELSCDLLIFKSIHMLSSMNRSREKLDSP